MLLRFLGTNYFVTCIILILVNMAYADSPQGDKKTDTLSASESNKEQTSDLSEPRVGNVELSRTLLGAKLVDLAKHPIGKVEDVAIDVTNAKVHAVYTSTAKSPSEPTHETIVVPYSTLQRSNNEPSFVITKLPERSSPMSEEPDEKNQLVLVNKNKNIEIRDSKDRLLGHIIDFALVPGKDQVAYSIFTTKQNVAELPQDQEYYPIPLSAYVLKRDPKTWILDLPKDLLKNTPTYTKNKLPVEIETAWTEYVRVRYGRPVMDGVQTEAPINKQKEK